MTLEGRLYQSSFRKITLLIEKGVATQESLSVWDGNYDVGNMRVLQQGWILDIKIYKI